MFLSSFLLAQSSCVCAREKCLNDYKMVPLAAGSLEPPSPPFFQSGNGQEENLGFNLLFPFSSSSFPK